MALTIIKEFAINWGDVLHSIGMSIIDKIFDGIHPDFIRAIIHLTNPRLTHFGIEVIKRGKGVYRRVVPIHLAVVLVDVMVVGTTQKLT